MNMRRVLLYLIFISCVLGAIASGALLWLPQLSEPGYFSANFETGEIKQVNGNAFKAFVSEYVGEIIEKDRTLSFIQPITTKEAATQVQKVEVKVDGSIFACSPSTPVPDPTPVPPPPPPPIPPPPPTGKVSWGITYTRVPEAQKIANGKGVKVCVVDTGVADHPQLQGVVIERHSTIGRSGVDVHGHGTHVIGTVAGPDGIGASKASIISVEVLGPDGSGSITGIINGFYKCRDRGAKVISASLGSDSPSPSFQAMVKALSDAGITTVMAGGNNGTSRFGYPAAYAAGIKNAYAVIATLSTGGRAPFSQYQPGFPLENVIAAPGTNIMSLLPMTGCTLCGTNRTGYGEMSGTSMATPLVAGIIADLISAGKINPLGNQSKDVNVGIIIDALKSVNGN